MFELVLEFFSSGRVLNNDSLREISALRIDQNSGEISKGNRKPINFIIGDISLYQGYEYNPDDMSIAKLDMNMNELKQAVKRTMNSVDKKGEKDIDIGIVSPQPSLNMGR